MKISPLSSDYVANDRYLRRTRRCRKCGGAMQCQNLTEYRVNSGYSGREYMFKCEGCKHLVTELSAYRAIYLAVILSMFGGLGGLLTYWGIGMLVDLIRRGPGGNDLSAVILVLVVFLGLGLPLFLGMLWWAKSHVSDWIELRRNPVVTG